MINHENKTAVIFGAEGGIGKSLYEQISKSQEFNKVIAFSKKTKPQFDITNEICMKELALSVSKLKISLLFNATGFLSDKTYLPEKRIEDISENYFIKSLSVNTLGNAFLIKYFAPLMLHETTSYFITLSARVSSISDNGLGGWYSYRASKAALNQLIKTASIEFKRKKSNTIFLSLHPGTVKTKLSKPFLRNMNSFSPDEAARRILDIYKTFDISKSGSLVDYKGDVIPY